MTRRTGVLGLLIVGSLVVSLAASGRVKAAAPAFSITTSPISLDLNIKPGTNTSATVQLMNNNPAPVAVAVQVETFSANGTNGEAALAVLPTGSPIQGWVHFSQTTFTAQPGVWTPIKVTFNIPPSASLGYYFALLFKPVIPTVNAPHTTILKGSNAVLVLIDTKSANEQRIVQVASFGTTKGLYEYLPVTFNVTVRNSGNIFLAPIGDIFISKSSNFTRPISSLSVNAAAGNILPNSVRTFQINWTKGFPVYQPKTLDGQPVTKNGVIQQQLHWDFTQLANFRFGEYYAHLALIYNNGTQDIPIDSVISFWVIPWKLLTILLIIVLLILFGLFAVGRLIYKSIKRIKR